MRKSSGLICFAALLLAGCGSTPQAPHVYVVGVDCSKSFWQAGVTGQRRAANLSRMKIQEIVYRLRDIVSEIKAVTEDGKFIKRTRQSENGFVKEIDRETIRKEIDNVMDTATVLANSAMDEKDRFGMAENLRGRLNTLYLTLNKRNYVKVSGRPGSDETIAEANLARVKALIDRANAVIDNMSYTVTVPEQPEVLTRTADNVSALTTLIDEDIAERARLPIDEQWSKRGVYGNLRSMYVPLYFKIGDDAGTVFQPAVSDLNAGLRRLLDESLRSGVRVFYGASDYRRFFQRSFKEIVNRINDWGDFDRDIGLSMTFIIIGDGKHDPAGKSEGGSAYDIAAIEDIKDFLLNTVAGDPAVSGVPWDNIREIRVKFCVPKNRYSTDVFDAWTRMLKAASPDGKITVNYYMFENLKDGSAFSKEAVRKLLD